MLFKNVSNKDARILLEILGKKSNTIKICTKELQLFDPTTFRPDIMLELDDEILITELQSTEVGEKHHKRFHVYVAIANYNNESEKEIKLCVLSSAEESKQIIYTVNDSNDFKYELIGLRDLESSEIINNIKTKIKNQEELTGKELILFSLIPIIEKQGNVEDYIDYVVETLINLKNLSSSIKALVFGVEWLIVDKFVKDNLKKNMLRDLLGEKMSMIYEYGQDREKIAEERIIGNLLKSGMKAETIAKTAKIPLSRVKAIERKLKLTKQQL